MPGMGGVTSSLSTVLLQQYGVGWAGVGFRLERKQQQHTAGLNTFHTKEIITQILRNEGGRRGGGGKEKRNQGQMLTV